MKKSLLRLVSILFLVQIAMVAHATHNRAGEIVVEQINGCSSNTVLVTVYTWTKTSSVPADRDSVTICWDVAGPCEIVARSNGNGEPLANDVKFNTYTAEHTYDGPGRYTVSMTDPNRNGGILNVNPPGSENVQFHLQTTFTLFSGQSQGCNSTPVLLNPPIDYACSGEPFVHNPGAYDVDGDSLSYELIIPLQDVNSPVPNYIWPPNVQNQGGDMTVNPLTGTLEWYVPSITGEYNVAIIIISWRNGIAIDTTIRDMQILVEDCDDNHAPEIEAPNEICVVAGDVVEFKVTGKDENDPGDKIKLSALGAPFDLAISPADSVEIWRPTGSPSATYEEQPVVKTFRWQTACEHISDLHYTVVFKAEDDFFIQSIPNSTGLASLKAVRIKVVGPPPLDVQAVPSSDSITVSWELPYVCEDAEDDFFLSFSVWRKEGNDNFEVDKCKPGLEGAGYILLGNTRSERDGRYFWVDNNVERGRTYCYRILARFAKRTETGQAYNIVESLASEKICVQLSREVPLITNVSINETATSNGEIDIRWIKPVAEDLDTLVNPGPYRYELIRTQGFQSSGDEIVATFEAPTYSELMAGQFTDLAPALNTHDNPYTYELAFYVNNEIAPLGYSPSASSVFLEIEPTDNKNILSWSFDVPWVNDTFYVFRQNAVGGWDSIATVRDTFYEDTGLLNGKEYCYYIRAYGSYGIMGVPEPLINLSQEACAVPIDNVPPCPPELTVRNICDDNRTCEDGEVLENFLTWVNPMEICEETDDVVSYNVYFSPTENGDLQLVASIDDSGTVNYEHQPERGIAGCYAVTALDTFFNESAFSNIFCVDNCPNFSLPNAFTPNGDGANDMYIPYPFCFIENIEMSIFNRWGQLVYETRDPNINWTGENLNGKELPAGTYYYTCKVFEQRVTGTVEAPELLNGYIDLVR